MNKWQGWLFWSMAVVFYFYEFVLQVSSGVLVQPLSKEFHLSATFIGLIGAIYFYSYAIMQLPAGILLDRFGTKKVLSIAVLFCALGSFILYGASDVYWILAARFVTAIGSAFAFIGALKTAEDWFSADRFSLLSGLTFSIGMLGAIFGKAPLAYIIEIAGWRDMMLGAAIVGLIISALFLLIYKEKPASQENKLINTDKKVKLKDFIPVFSNIENWKAALYGGLMLAPMLALAGLWGEKYLMDVYEHSSIEAAGSISLLLVGFGIGSPIAGWFTDWIKRCKPSMFISAIGTLICFIGIVLVGPSFLQKIIILLLGFFTAFSITVFTLIRALNPVSISATALGFTNLMGVIIGALSQTFIGLILDFLWNGDLEGHSRIYLIHHYHTAFLFLFVSIILALLLTFFIKEPKFKG